MEVGKPRGRPRSPLSLGKSFSCLGSPLLDVNWLWSHLVCSPLLDVNWLWSHLVCPMRSYRRSWAGGETLWTPGDPHIPESRGSRPKEWAWENGPAGTRLWAASPTLGWGSVATTPAAPSKDQALLRPGVSTGPSDSTDSQAWSRAVSARRRVPPPSRPCKAAVKAAWLAVRDSACALGLCCGSSPLGHLDPSAWGPSRLGPVGQEPVEPEARVRP